MLGPNLIYPLKMYLPVWDWRGRWGVCVCDAAPRLLFAPIFSFGQTEEEEWLGGLAAYGDLSGTF